MKLLKFKTVNHPILGDFSIDFQTHDSSSSIILIAGSNGSGKTTILDTIFNLLTDLSKLRTVSYGVYLEISLTDTELVKARIVDPILEKHITIEATSCYEGMPPFSNLKVNSLEQLTAYNLLNDKIFQDLFKIIYSTVEINFYGDPIMYATSGDIDSTANPRERSDSSISQSITQLLVDISSSDNQDAADWIEQNQGRKTEIVKQEKRISRFKKAFDFMIKGKTFHGVKNESGRKKVYFKNPEGVEIDIFSLSSGEKQIAFRAGYLLKNLGSLSGGIILIDEPEISFHPTWQQNYVNFLKTILQDSSGGLQSQIIITTHSPFIIQNENLSDEKVIILEKEGNNTIVSNWPEFYGYTKPQPIITPIELPERPLLLVEGVSDKRVLLYAWNILNPHVEIPFDIKWAGEPNSGGASLLQRQLLTLQQHARQKVIGIYDGDEKGLNEYKGTKTSQQHDFKIDDQISSLKILNKVGVTYLPTPHFREKYFNWQTPKFSLLTVELFFLDEILYALDLLEENIQIGNEQLVKLKTNHMITDDQLSSLSQTDFNAFEVIFSHIENCFSRIN